MPVSRDAARILSAERVPHLRTAQRDCHRHRPGVLRVGSLRVDDQAAAVRGQRAVCLCPAGRHCGKFMIGGQPGGPDTGAASRLSHVQFEARALAESDLDGRRADDGGSHGGCGAAHAAVGKQVIATKFDRDIDHRANHPGGRDENGQRPYDGLAAATDRYSCAHASTLVVLLTTVNSGASARRRRPRRVRQGGHAACAGPRRGGSTSRSRAFTLRARTAPAAINWRTRRGLTPRRSATAARCGAERRRHPA